MSDDTLAIQNRINAVDNFGVTYLPPGTYTVQPLNVPAAVKYLLPDPTIGTTLKLAPMQGDSARVLNVKRPGGIYIGSITFDMNRDEQGWDGKYSHEHQAAIFLENCEARISSAYIEKSAGNGIHVYNGATATLFGVRASSCHRGALTVSGNNNRTEALNCKLEYVNIEEKIQTATLDVTFDHVTTDVLEVGLTPLSKFVGTNLTVGHMPKTYAPPGCVCLLKDSQLGLTNFRLPHATIERCTFTAPAGTTGQVISLAWAHGPYSKGMTFSMKDCKVNGVGGQWGAHLNTDLPANGNLFECANTAFTNVGIPVYAKRKGNWNLSGVTLNGNPWP